MHVSIIPVGMLGTNSYLLASGAKSCALIDPGAQPEKLASIIEENGYTLRYVLLTHGHWDHTGAVKDIMKKFPNAMCFIGNGDKAMLTDHKAVSYMISEKDWDDFHIPDVRGLAEGDALELDELKIQVIETPGHTVGSVCYICDDAIFTGDTLFHGSIGRCDFPGGDFGTMRKSLLRLAKMAGQGKKYAVYPGHGDTTTLEYESKNNPYILYGG